MTKKFVSMIAAMLAAGLCLTAPLTALESTESVSDSVAGEITTPATPDAVISSDEPVFTADDLQFPQGTSTQIAIPDTAMQTIKGMQQGTFLVRFTPESTGIQSLLGFSDSRAGYPSSYLSFFVASGRMGFEIRKQSGGDYEKKSVSVAVRDKQENYAAMIADPNYGYKLFLNGAKVLELPISQLSTTLGYGFLSDIPSLDSGAVGRTNRNDVDAKPTANQYPFYGSMKHVAIYNAVLTDEWLMAETAKVNPSEAVYSAYQLELPAGSSGVEIPADAMERLRSLHGGTILARFTPQISGLHSLLGVSNGSDGYPNSYFNVYIAQGKAGFEIRQQTGGDYQKSSVTADISSGQEQYLAMVADPDFGYKLFLNGEEIYRISNQSLSTPLGYGFIDNIAGVNAAYVGKTKRIAGSTTPNQYIFNGKIELLEVYDRVWSDAQLIEETGKVDPSGRRPVRRMNLFQVSDWNSPAFRIPSMLTTDEGVIMAAADIRFGDSDDSPNNIDIGLRTSSDGGATWSEPKLILNFLDYPNQPTRRLSNSASFIDCVLTKGDNNRVFLFVDAWPGGVGQKEAQAASGFINVDGQRRVVLVGKDSKQYYVGGDQKVYEQGSNIVTEYSVGEQFSLLKNGQPLSNIFYKASPLTVLNTSYICMMYTDDSGQSWSDPVLMDFKTEDMKFFGVAPGIGIQIKNGAHAGRLLVPMYYTSTLNTTEFACVVYSDDNGQTWQRGESPNDGRIGGPQKMHESQLVEMPDGQIKMYARSLSKASVATSFDGGQTWDDTVEFDTELVMSASTGCQLSIINYSQPVQGKPAVIFSNPAATKRANGAVRMGVINQTGTHSSGQPKWSVQWLSKKVIRPGEFAYSCLTELPNHNIANLFEENNAAYTLDHLVYEEYTLDYLMN